MVGCESKPTPVLKKGGMVHMAESELKWLEQFILGLTKHKQEKKNAKPRKQ